MKKSAKILASLLAVCMMLPLAGCGIAPVQNGTRTITDHAGNEVRIPDEIDSVVCTDLLPLPSVLTVFFDSAEKIKGIAPNSMTAAKNGLLGELYPEILEAETGFMTGSSVNVEELMKMEPDVVFYSASNPDLGTVLTAAGFNAVALSVNKWGYNSIETLNNWISLLSQIFPDNDKAEIVAKYSEETYNMVQERVADLADADRQRAFFLFKYDETMLQTSGSSFFGHWWAEAIGAVNVAAELTADNAVAVNMEQIYQWNPSLIFITNFTSAMPEDLENNAIGSDNWSAVDAVINGNVHKMPLGMYRSYTPGVDTPITLLWLAKAAYPELFADIDIPAKTIEYYNEVFGITLTEEQAASIFAPSAAVGTGFSN